MKATAIFCQMEADILRDMGKAMQNVTPFTSRDVPCFTTLLINHRHNCATCQGVPLEEQLFRAKVKVTADYV